MPQILDRTKKLNENRGPGRPKYSSAQANKLFTAFEGSDQEWRYGYDLVKETGIAPGTVYPILRRLEADGILDAKWELTDGTAPPRKLYRIKEEFRV